MLTWNEQIKEFMAVPRTLAECNDFLEIFDSPPQKTLRAAQEAIADIFYEEFVDFDLNFES